MQRYLKDGWLSSIDSLYRELMQEILKQSLSQLNLCIWESMQRYLKDGWLTSIDSLHQELMQEILKWSPSSIESLYWELMQEIPKGWLSSIEVLVWEFTQEILKWKDHHLNCHVACFEITWVVQKRGWWFCVEHEWWYECTKQCLA